MSLPKAWSYSSLTKFETCPYQYHQTKVLKVVKEEDTEAQLWGIRVHTALEHRVRDKVPLVEELQMFEPLAAIFDDKPGVSCEKEYMLDENLEPVTDYADAWCIGIIDVEVLKQASADLYDWKTGKKKADSKQMWFYSGLVMQTHPEVQKVRNKYVWLKTMEDPTSETVKREQLPSIWQEFIPRVRRLEQAYERDKWPCRPSGLCRGWCSVKHCRYYEPKRNTK